MARIYKDDSIGQLDIFLEQQTPFKAYQGIEKD